METDFGEIQKQLSADKDKLTKQIAESCAEEWSGLVEECISGLEKTSEKAEAASEQLENGARKLQNALADWGKIAESAVDMEGRTAAMAEASRNLCQDIDRMKAALEDFTREQNNVLERTIAQSDESRKRLIQKMQVDGETFTGEIKTASEAYTSEIRIAGTALQENLSGFTTELFLGRKHLTEFTEQIGSGIESLEELIRIFREDKCRTVETLEGLSQKAGEYLECLEASCRAAEEFIQAQKEVADSNAKKDTKRFYLLVGMLFMVAIFQILNFSF